MKNIFNEISDEKKILLKEVAVKTLTDFKSKHKNRYLVPMDELRIKAMYVIDREKNNTLNKLEKLYIKLYLFTEDDDKYLNTCKKYFNRNSENKMGYDFNKIGEYYGIKSEFAYLRYKIAIDNMRIQRKDEEETDIDKIFKLI